MATGGVVAMGGESGVSSGGSGAAGESPIAACDGLPFTGLPGQMCVGTEQTVSAVGCRVELPLFPQGKLPDLDKMGLTFTPSDELEQGIPRVEGVDGCASAPNGGWYADPANSRELLLCPCSCLFISMPGTLRLVLGCSTLLP